MFVSMQSRLNKQRSGNGALVDIAPLIDIVFILLIFFLVTSTFVRDTGIEVTRPEAITADLLEPTSMRISIAASGEVYTEGRNVDLGTLEQNIREFVSRERKATIIIIPDATVPSSRLVEVMDAARLGGATELSVATQRGS
jgi:biopolymer transport protein ExbD